jgi:hypothetical protein
MAKSEVQLSAVKAKRVGPIQEIAQGMAQEL